MKHITPFILLFLISFSVFSQDRIKKTNGDTLKCKISEITSFYLKYKTDTTTHFLSVDSIAGYQLEFSDFVEVSKDNLIKKYNDGKMPKKYFIAISPGIGENHGVGGLKVLIGPDGNTGIFGCIGHGIMSVFWKAGLQINSDWFYAAWSAGTMEFYETGNFVYETNKVYGMTIEIGGIINLNRSKRFFLQLGVGYNFPFEKIDYISYAFYHGRVELTSFTGVKPELGLGVKF